VIAHGIDVLDSPVKSQGNKLQPCSTTHKLSLPAKLSTAPKSFLRDGPLTLTHSSRTK